MFCSNCGRQLPDGARFCDVCGTQTGAPVQVQEPKEPNPMFRNLLTLLKDFFTGSPVKAVGNAAKSTSLEWIFIAGTLMLTYALALATNIWQLLDSILGDASAMVMEHVFSYGQWLLYGFLLSAGSYALMAVLIFLTMKLIFKKDVSIMNAFNLVSAASVPLLCAYVMAILVGFIWFPLVLIFCAVGLVATAVLLYAGMQKMQKLEVSPFLAYIVIWAMVVFTLVALVAIVGNVAMENSANALGNIGRFLG